ncbi:MAG: hypothetical protein ACOX51_00405 [Myxococcota bacterium]|nr:hypothetical protein [Myxococcota bacterium]MBP8971008.1 hypothetical protein [Myxococcota bacterium]HHW96328.1 hypothetical protein [Oligoflexales bacterium]HQC44249.1 hypothetical protein [Myxococcota bacterium]HQL57291.1 hypothetical protein [Myxococcota bacterium]
MKPFARLISILALVMAISIPMSVDARDMNGKFGIGYDQSLGGVSGLSLKYHLGNFVLWGTLGFDLFKPTESDPRTAVRFALAGLYDFARFEKVNLGVGVKLDVGWKNGAAITAERRDAAGCEPGASCPVVESAKNTWQVNIELPLVAEVFLTDHFSIHLVTGITFNILTSKDVVLTQNTGRLSTDTKEKGFGFGVGNGSLFGAAGFSVYF